MAGLTGMAGVFKSIGDAKVTTRGEFAKPGDYLFEVAVIKFFDGNAGHTHVVEFFVREAVQKGAEAPSAIGSRVSVVNLFSGNTAKVAPSKVKGFTEALLGLSEADDVGSQVEKSVSETNPCKGMLIRADSYEFKSKAGTKGTSLNFRHVPGQTKAEIKARAAAQG